MNRKGYLKWQQIAGYGGGGLVGVFIILGLLLNLAGMSYTHDGDKICETDCFSEIRVNSTFWEIKVEHAGDKDILFKKQTRSRTLWLNLDKIDSVLTTNPEVETEILVGAISRTSTIDHPEYGYLRPLKDGDTLIKRTTKSNPYPSRIIVHGTKSPEQTVKWSFFLDDILIEDINIDPSWIGQEKKPDEIPSKKIREKHTPTTDTICQGGKCTQAIYSGVRNVFEDGKWKKIEEARSLKDSNFNVVYLEDDARYPLKVLDYNYTSISVELNPNGLKNYDVDIPVRILEEDGELFEEYINPMLLNNGITKSYYFPFGGILKFGLNSTTIMLQDPDSENLEDLRLKSSGIGYNEFWGIYKFNMSSIPEGQTITGAILGIYSIENGSAFDGKIGVWRIDNQTWNETIANGSQIQSLIQDQSYNQTFFSGLSGVGGLFYDLSHSNITDMVKIEYSKNNNHTTFLVGETVTAIGSSETSTNPGNGRIKITAQSESNTNDWIDVTFKEHSTSSQRPYLNITYEAPVFTPNVTSLTESPSDPATYSSTQFYEFNSTVVDDVGIDTVLLQFDGVNYSAHNLTANVYNKTFLPLSAGTYNYLWFANDTTNNVNNTESGTYTVNRANGDVDTFVNHSRADLTVNEGDTIELNSTLVDGQFGSLNQTVNGLQINYSTTKNLTTLYTFSTAGSFLVNTNYSGNTNYTNNSEAWTVTVLGKNYSFFLDGSPISNANNISLEVGTDVNITANLSTPGYKCADIDHHTYGNRFICANQTNDINFLFEINNFRKEVFNINEPSAVANFTGTGGSFTINDTGIQINTHQYDFVDNVSLDIFGLNRSYNVTIYEINSTNIDRYYHGHLIGDRIYLNVTTEEVGRKVLTDSVGGVEKFIFFNLDDNIGQSYSLSFNLTGLTFGINFYDNFTNYTLINQTNLSAQINGPVILSNGTELAELVYDDFEDGSFQSDSWSKTADLAVGPEEISNTESNGVFTLQTITSRGDSGGEEVLDNQLTANRSRFNLQHTGNITLHFNYSSTMTVDELSSNSYLFNNITFGDRLIWKSNWTNCHKFPIQGDCTGNAEIIGNSLIINLTNYLNGSFGVNIVGMERVYGTAAPGQCGSYEHIYNWTDGTYLKTFSVCSNISGILSNDFTIFPDYSEDPALLFGQDVRCTYGTSGCKTTTNTFRIQNVNKTQWRRYNGTVISNVIYEAETEIAKATPVFSTQIVHPNSSINNVYNRTFLSADNGTTWESVTSGVEHTFTVRGKKLKWRVDLIVNQTNQYFNDSLWLDSVNVTIASAEPSNITIDWGGDGVIDATFKGEINETNSPIKIVLPAINLTNSFKNASRVAGNSYQIPLGIKSDTIGTVRVDNINLTYRPNPVPLNTTYFNRFLNQSTNQTNLTISIGANDGLINLTGLKYDFAGGNDTNRLIVYPTNFTVRRFNNTLTNETLTFDLSTRNHTRYLSLPIPLSISHAHLNLSSFNIPQRKESLIYTHHTFNESSGLDAEESVTGIHNLTTNGNFTIGGLRGNAYWADGAEQIESSFNLSSFGNITINFWLNSTGATTGDRIMRQGVGSELLVRYQSGGQFNVVVNNTALSPGGGQFDLNNNQWYMITIRFNATNSSLWVNGTYNATGVGITGSDFNFSEDLCLLSGIDGSTGQCDGSQQVSNLVIDELSFFNNSLTDDKILNLYNNGTPRDLQTISQLTSNPNITFYLEVGNVDGTKEWIAYENFTNNQTGDLVGAIKNYSSSCGTGENCTVPFNFFVEFSHNNTPITVNLNYTNISVNYDRKVDNDTLIIESYFSTWDYVFGPQFVNFLEFIPQSAIDRNVTPFGQTSDTPILNITNIEYHPRSSNLSLSLNETLGCINITASTDNQKINGSIINQTWLDLNTDLSYEEVTNIWLWADYACGDNQNWTLFLPNFYFRTCANSTICDADLT